MKKIKINKKTVYNVYIISTIMYTVRTPTTPSRWSDSKSTIILLLNLLKSRWCMVFSFIPSPTRLLQVRRKCFDRSLKCFPHVVPMLLHPPHKVLSRADNCFTKPSPHLPCTHLVNMRHSLMINTFFRAEVRKFIILHNGPNAMGL